MAERSIAAVLKTVEPRGSGGSNPSLSAKVLSCQNFFMHCTYILRSLKDGGFYFGHCEDLQKRLKRHNARQVRSTKARVPFVIHYFEKFESKSQAYARELFFKSFEGRKWLHKMNII